MSSFYNGKHYALDMKKVCEFFTYSDAKDFKEKEITDAYEIDDEKNMQLISKIVRENKAPGNGTIDNIKYDFIKILIIQVLNANSQTISEEIGTTIAFDTLIREGYLVEVE